MPNTGWVGGSGALGSNRRYRPGDVIDPDLIGLPSSLRTVQPIIQDRTRRAKRAPSASVRPLQNLYGSFPALLPATLTGSPWRSPPSAGGREYGPSCHFAGNMPDAEEIVPLLHRHEDPAIHYAGASEMAVVMSDVVRDACSSSKC